MELWVDGYNRTERYFQNYVTKLISNIIELSHRIHQNLKAARTDGLKVKSPCLVLPNLFRTNLSRNNRCFIIGSDAFFESGFDSRTGYSAIAQFRN